MRSRALRILVLVWIGWWFAVYVPGHQRGAIRVDVAAGNAVSAPVPCGSCVSPEGKPASPADDPVRDCGVCYLVAKLDTPQTPTFSLPPLTPTLSSPDRALVGLLSREAASIFFGRAPPLA